jgi:hypothetical protein
LVSSRASSRLTAGVLAGSALALFGLAFTPWFQHEELSGPRERFLRDDPTLVLSLSGWDLETDLAALVLFAVFSGLGAALWLARRPQDRLVPVACLLAVAAAATAAWRIEQEIRSPSDDIYNDVQLGARLALAAAIALAVVGALAAIQSLYRAEARTASAAPPRTLWPAVVGAAGLYVLAILVNATEIWRPEALLLCCCGAILGYAVPRWWLAVLPVPVVVALAELTDPCNPNERDCSEAGLRTIVYGFVAVAVAAAIAIGIATRVLQRRAASQQHV